MEKETDKRVSEKMVNYKKLTTNYWEKLPRDNELLRDKE